MKKSAKKSAFAEGQSNTNTFITDPMVWSTLYASPVASQRTDDIWFFDQNNGWLVNSSGYACKTTNGGVCWEPKLYVCPTTGAYPYLRCMGWGSEQVGWIGSVVGLPDSELGNPEKYVHSLLRHTTDGGETWTNVTNIPVKAGLTPSGICGFYAVNEQVAYGSGTNDPGMPGPAIIKTTDGGKNWELIDMQAYANNLIDIYFMDENNGFVVGGKNHDTCEVDCEYYPPPRLSRYGKLKPVVLRTRDGGKTWTNMVENTQGFKCGEWGWKIQFVDDKIGFVSLENFASAGILKTVDGGETWTRHDVKDRTGNIINRDLEGIGFINEKQGWVGGWGINFHGLMNSFTQDGGETWEPQNNNPAIATSVGQTPSDLALSAGNSDDRVRINRYRFIRDDKGNLITGYCSGKQVYKLAIVGTKKSAFAAKDGDEKKQAFADETSVKKAAFSQNSDTTCSDEAGSTQKQSFAANKETVDFPKHDYKLDYKKHSDGKVEISYDVPEGVENVFVGLWNQLAFYVKTLVKGSVEKTGRHTVIWDGNDDEGKPVGEGVYICRLSADGCEGSSQMVKLSKR